MFIRTNPNILYQRAKHRSKATQIFEILGDIEGQVIGDLGAAGGYFSILFGKKVGDLGFVYAMETDPNKFEFIKKLIRENEAGNIDAVLLENSSVPLQKGSIDKFFLRHSYHHIENPEYYFEKLKDKLKPDGQIIIIEHKKPKMFSLRYFLGHFVPQKIIINSMEKAGYKLVTSHDLLKIKSFSIFQVK